ncbi:MAG TPA: cytochrome P450 [Pseudonocardia sp.]|jgi:cytochrome P450/NADPH-cytochrome P450 reductase
MATPLTVEEIPGPRGVPLLGNVFDIDSHSPFESLMDLAREYGSIYRLSVRGASRLIVSDPALTNEICDDSRFDKQVGGGLGGLRKSAVGSGLFTSDTADPLWRRAHNILLSPFSLHSMHEYLPMMLDLAHQLMDKWERLNPDEEIDVPADMTRLTLDTIALCGFGYRFNSFYRDTQHPFVAAMVRTLSTSQARARQLPIQQALDVRTRRQMEEDQAFMDALVDQLVRDRRAQGEAGGTRDLLGRMLNGVDKQTGEKLPDSNIREQCITFLVAGHETTSGLLSFAVQFLLKHPEVVARAQAEVDEVLGGTVDPTYEQVHRLTYCTQILNESLRLWPTAPGFTRAPLADTVIGDRYALPAGTPLTVLSAMLHRDRGVWGEDAEEFNPDHVSPERTATLPPNAFKPFGTGQRACIGRQFAMQEAVLVLGMLLQRFEFVDFLDYKLRIKTTLTMKPDDLRIQVRPRANRLIEAPTGGAAVAAPRTRAAEPAAGPATPVVSHGTPLTVLYGSNLGTAEGLAITLAGEATQRGYQVTQGALDEYAGRPPDGAVIVVSSSYNGTPPDNAGAFCRWLRDPSTPADACAGMSYTVFGCGSTEWAATYQAVPTLLDDGLAARGARRLLPRGEGDAAGDFDAQFRSWHAGLWAGVAEGLGLPAGVAAPAATAPRLSVSLVNRQLANPVIMSYSARPSTVRENRELIRTNGAPPDRSTRHVEVALPDGVGYSAGDHLGVLPRNSLELIRRVMLRFGLDAGQYATIIPNGGAYTHLPVEEPTPLLGVLGSCVELQDVATRSHIEVLARYTADPAERADLAALVGDDERSHRLYRGRVSAANRSVLDLLDEFPSCAPPFDVYLDLLPALRPRYYSISSSPLVSPEVCSITTGVLRGPARCGTGEFHGVCSNHLALAAPNSTVFTFVRRPTIAFRPPADPATPMIMVGAGTGLAPFRGFLQERAAEADRGEQVGNSLLFFGCRDPQRDQLYADELRDLAKLASARVHTVFSNRPEDGRRYVQHEMLARRDEVWDLVERGAAIFVCGNANTMAPGVRASLADIHRQRTGGSAEDAQRWLADLRATDRFVEDIWGG